MKLQSSAFRHGEAIPVQFTGEGVDCSPPLTWTDVPANTREFALICDDPDAPTPEPWVHWVIFSLPAELRGLPEGVATAATLDDPPGAKQGSNTWTDGSTIGYRGPMPPPGHGVHHYYFRLYAVDCRINCQAGSTKSEVLAQLEGHILSMAELIGTYER